MGSIVPRKGTSKMTSSESVARIVCDKDVEFILMKRVGRLYLRRRCLDPSGRLVQHFVGFAEPDSLRQWCSEDPVLRVSPHLMRQLLSAATGLFSELSG